MSLKQISDITAIALLIGVPLLLSTESSTRQVLYHPLGLFLLVPVGVILANRLYPSAKLSNGLIALQVCFFGLWTFICLSVLKTRTTESGLDASFTPIFKALGFTYHDAAILGMYSFVLVFFLSLTLVFGILLYAAICRSNNLKRKD